MPKVTNIIEGTFLLVLVFLVLTNAAGFNTVASAIGSVYTSAVRALQARD